MIRLRKEEMVLNLAHIHEFKTRIDFWEESGMLKVDLSAHMLEWVCKHTKNDTFATHLCHSSTEGSTYPVG